jgi:FkbM family methyltransferase
MGKIKRTFGFILSHPLSKKHPFKSICRLLYWQIQSTLRPSKFIIKPFVSSVKFYARKGLTGITGNIYTGLHEFNDMAFLLHFLRPQDIFIDVGANVGSYTLLASGVCRTQTIAIEPSQNTAGILHKNIILNQLQKKVTLINKAAGSREHTLAFSKNEDTTNHVIAQDESTNTAFEKVKIISLDSLTINNKPALIKIDVEGFETEVLNGMADTFKQPSLKAIIIELNGSGARYGFDEHNIHLLLTINGFNPYLYNPFKRELKLTDSHGHFNTIYCRDVEFIAERLKTANGFKIMGEII